jgi:predicted nucleotide-binding protein
MTERAANSRRRDISPVEHRSGIPLRQLGPAPWAPGRDGCLVRLLEERREGIIPGMPSFSGLLDELKDRLLVAGIDGDWVERGQGVWQLRCPDGANLNWSSTKGTIWCDGKESAKSALEAKVADTLETSFEPKAASPARAASPASRNVFVIYGHDEPARTSLEAMLRRWDLEPLILDQLASGGQTIIEKLESVRKEAIAVVLATPDDEGHRRDHPEEKAFRVRQNVVLELGMMLSVLGRSKVAIVLKSDVNMERPSDIHGLIYVPFKDDVREAALVLAKEINARIPIDLSRV